MDIQVVLTQDDSKLGKRGEVVKVSPGYANNFLIPHQKAILATAANLKRFQEEKVRHGREDVERRSRAEALVQRINQTPLTIEVLTGEAEKLYGAVTVQDILNALSGRGIALEKKDVHLEEPIRKLGVYEVDIKPYPSVGGKLKLSVVKKKV